MVVSNKNTVDSPIAEGGWGAIQYDKRGNIEHLRRNGGVGGCDAQSGVGWQLVDNLEYSYNSQNQLTSLTDTERLYGGVRYDQSAMEYDNNGNLIKDSGKNISQIEYNYLNLPSKIRINTAGKEDAIE